MRSPMTDRSPVTNALARGSRYENLYTQVLKTPWVSLAVLIAIVNTHPKSGNDVHDALTGIRNTK